MKLYFDTSYVAKCYLNEKDSEAVRHLAYASSGYVLLRVASLVAALPAAMYLRAGEPIHLAAAQEAGFTEIWTNDRRLIEAAPAFGLTGKSL